MKETRNAFSRRADFERTRALRGDPHHEARPEDPAPSEKVSLALILEELEKPKAEERRIGGNQAGGRRGKEVNPKIGETSHRRAHAGEVDEIVGKTIGMSRTTYFRAKAVVRAASDETLPAETRAIAAECMKQMDEKGKVMGAFDRIAPLDSASTTQAPDGGRGGYAAGPASHRRPRGDRTISRFC